MALATIARNKLSPGWFKFLLNLYPPNILGRIILKTVAPDFKEINVLVKKSIWNKNLANTIFGGTIFSAADPYYPLMYWQIFAHRHNERVLVWLKSAEIKYKKPSDTNLTLSFKLSEDDIAACEKALNEKGKHNAHHIVEAKNNKGEVCAIVSIVAYIGRTSKERK